MLLVKILKMSYLLEILFLGRFSFCIKVYLDIKPNHYLIKIYRILFIK